jgi:subtilisin
MFKYLFLAISLVTLAFGSNLATKEFLKTQYDEYNKKLPSEKVSMLDILNSSQLYSSISGTSDTNTSVGLLDKLITITDKLAEDGEASVILKLQMPFYPEGVLEYAYDVEDQKQRIFDTLIPIIEESMLDEQQMLDSLQIFDSIPYFSITLNQGNFWKLLECEGIIDIELNEFSSPSLIQSTQVIQATNAWNSGSTGAGQTVAILDTGVKKSHEMFSGGKVVSEACYSGGGYAPYSVCPGGVTQSTAAGSGEPCNLSLDGGACHHGTHVAGIAAGNGPTQKGVAKDANVIAIQVFSNHPSYGVVSYSNDQIKALERVFALKDTYNIASANMSLGGGTYTSYCNSDSRKAIIDNLLSVGIATVIASGNNGYTNAVGAPGCIETAVTVGATSDGGYGAVDTVTSYSNSAYIVDLLAPGSLITSATATSNSSYESWHGTSMATPHVAGAFALLKSSKNDMSIAEGLNALQNSGTSVTDSKNGITKKRINVNGALDLLGTGSVTVTLSPSTAQWKIDGGDWKNSGSTVSDIFLGSHAITFSSVTHSNPDKLYVTPSSQTVTLDFDGDSASLNVSYQERDKPKNLNRDFDGNGKTDILLRNSSDGSHYAYILDGTTASGSFIKNADNSVPKPSYSTWVSYGTPDINGDGKSDILLRNKYDGSYYAYILDGTTASGSFIKNADNSIPKPSYTSWSK